MNHEPRFCPGFKRARSQKKVMRHHGEAKYDALKSAYNPQEITADELKALVKKMKLHLSVLVQNDPCTTKTTGLAEGDVAHRWGLAHSEFWKLRDAEKVTILFQTYRGVHRCRLTALRAFESKYKQ